MNQSELKAKTGNRRQAREKPCEQNMIGLGVISDWLKNGASCFNQSHGVVAKPKKTLITRCL